jgi:hypothetical protein
MPKTQRLSAGLVVAASLLAAPGCERVPEYTYASPEEAMAAVDQWIGTGHLADEVLGPASADIISSGDAEADHKDGLRVKEMIAEGIEFEDYGEDSVVAFLGNDDWPFPFPLVREGERWRFDIEGGREELQNRRIGRNELRTLETLRAIVDAQREYRELAPLGTPAYARKFLSSEGARDGLYWPVAEGEPESPAGPLLARAGRDEPRPAGGEPRPFRGYYYRVLESQGPDAPGGARSYLDDQGRMTGGFAVLAWPSKYGNSGLMTFQVNQNGIVFQKDLGEETPALAAAITAYSPDSSWDPTGD